MARECQLLLLLLNGKHTRTSPHTLRTQHTTQHTQHTPQHTFREATHRHTGQRHAASHPHSLTQPQPNTQQQQHPTFRSPNAGRLNGSPLKSDSTNHTSVFPPGHLPGIRPGEQCFLVARVKRAAHTYDSCRRRVRTRARDAGGGGRRRGGLSPTAPPAPPRTGAPAPGAIRAYGDYA